MELCFDHLLQLMIHVTRLESLVQVWVQQKINVNYTYIEELSKVNAQVSLFHQHEPIALLTERTTAKKIKSVPSLWSLIDH